jgi:hypothetical protein
MSFYGRPDLAWCVKTFNVHLVARLRIAVSDQTWLRSCSAVASLCSLLPLLIRLTKLGFDTVGFPPQGSPLSSAVIPCIPRSVCELSFMLCAFSDDGRDILIWVDMSKLSS